MPRGHVTRPAGSNIDDDLVGFPHVVAKTSALVDAPHLEAIFRFAARLVVSGRGTDDMSRFVGSLYDDLCHFEPGLEEIFVHCSGAYSGWWEATSLHSSRASSWMLHSAHIRKA